MKTCEKCGEEVGLLDGDNVCSYCEQDEKNKAKRSRANAKRRSREDVLRSCGLIKVRGAMGGTYWE